MTPIKQTEVLSIIEEMIKSIHQHDLIKQDDILFNHPWTKKWLGNRNHIIDLEEISTGDNFEITSERPTSELRRDMNLEPLLNVKISSSTGERYIRFLPVSRRESERFILL